MYTPPLSHSLTLTPALQWWVIVSMLRCEAVVNWIAYIANYRQVKSWNEANHVETWGWGREGTFLKLLMAAWKGLCSCTIKLMGMGGDQQQESGFSLHCFHLQDGAGSIIIIGGSDVSMTSEKDRQADRQISCENRIKMANSETLVPMLSDNLQKHPHDKY